MAREGVPARGFLELWAVWAWEYHEPGPPNEPGPLASPEPQDLQEEGPESSVRFRARWAEVLGDLPNCSWLPAQPHGCLTWPLAAMAQVLLPCQLPAMNELTVHAETT